jgi:hypothetical protein
VNRRTELRAKPGKRLSRGTRLAPVSAKRKAENRERRAMVRRLWPDGQPPCCRPGCTRLADDLHEPLTRARGGSITDEENAKPLCRPCHDEITFSPESELGWAYECGLLVHSWTATAAGDPS